uniref:Uncharacterized protein n=1 Tax=Rhizophora mucronata TaxID=61149 RepID=A0A2P2P5D5_RHIMU
MLSVYRYISCLVVHKILNLYFQGKAMASLALIFRFLLYC